MNIFLGGASYGREWRSFITPAYTQPFIPVPPGVEYPFEYLWKNWIKGGEKSILGGQHNYVGPFSIGEDVPAAYLPKVYNGIKAFLYSIRMADVAYFYLEQYDGETKYRDDAITQLGYAIAQKDVKPFSIIVNTSEMVDLGEIPTNLIDVVVNTYDALKGLEEGLGQL